MKHVRMAIYQLRHGRSADVVYLARRDLVPQLRQQKGFVAYELVTTAHDGLVSYSVWTTRQAAQAASGVVKRWVDANIADDILDTELHIGDMAFSTRDPLPA